MKSTAVIWAAIDRFEGENSRFEMDCGCTVKVSLFVRVIKLRPSVYIATWFKSPHVHPSVLETVRTKARYHTLVNLVFRLAAHTYPATNHSLKSKSTRATNCNKPNTVVKETATTSNRRSRSARAVGPVPSRGQTNITAQFYENRKYIPCAQTYLPPSGAPADLQEAPPQVLKRQSLPVTNKSRLPGYRHHLSKLGGHGNSSAAPSNPTTTVEWGHGERVLVHGAPLEGVLRRPRAQYILPQPGSGVDDGTEDMIFDHCNCLRVVYMTTR